MFHRKQQCVMASGSLLDILQAGSEIGYDVRWVASQTAGNFSRPIMCARGIKWIALKLRLFLKLKHEDQHVYVRNSLVTSHTRQCCTATLL